MAKYRKKPLEIEAELYREGMEDYFKYHIPMFGLFTKQECIDAGFTPDFEKDKIPFIKTLEGEHIVSKGDYIITGIEGERYPCKPDIFHKTYEKVDNNSEIKLEKIRTIADVDILYSEYTSCFYVSGNLEIKDGGFLLSPVEHRKTREEAIDAYFERIINSNLIVIDAMKPNRAQYIYYKGEFTKVN